MPNPIELESAISECSQRVIDRGKAIRAGNREAEAHADTQIASALQRASAHAPSRQHARHLSKIASNYSSSDRDRKDKIITALRTVLLGKAVLTLATVAGVAAISAGLIGTQVAGGTIVQNGDGTSTLFQDGDGDGLIDQAVVVDQTGQAVGEVDTDIGLWDVLSVVIGTLFGGN